MIKTPYKPTHRKPTQVPDPISKENYSSVPPIVQERRKPTPFLEPEEDPNINEMTLRDFFAAFIMLGISGNPKADLSKSDALSETCYKLASSMVKVRDKK